MHLPQPLPHWASLDLHRSLSDMRADTHMWVSLWAAVTWGMSSAGSLLLYHITCRMLLTWDCGWGRWCSRHTDGCVFNWMHTHLRTVWVKVKRVLETCKTVSTSWCCTGAWSPLRARLDVPPWFLALFERQFTTLANLRDSYSHNGSFWIFCISKHFSSKRSTESPRWLYLSSLEITPFTVNWHHHPLVAESMK